MELTEPETLTAIEFMKGEFTNKFMRVYLKYQKHIQSFSGSVMKKEELNEMFACCSPNFPFLDFIISDFREILENPPELSLKLFYGLKTKQNITTVQSAYISSGCNDKPII